MQASGSGLRVSQQPRLHLRVFHDAGAPLPQGKPGWSSPVIGSTNWLETAHTYSVTGVCGLRRTGERFLRAPQAQAKHPVGQSSTVRAETLASWLPPSRVTTFTVNTIGLQQI